MATIHVEGDVLRIAGAIDETDEPELRDACGRLAAGTADPVTLDLTGVTFVNSVSIGIFVALCMDLRGAGRRAVLKPSTTMKRILDITGLTETFAMAARPA